MKKETKVALIAGAIVVVGFIGYKLMSGGGDRTGQPEATVVVDSTIVTAPGRILKDKRGIEMQLIGTLGPAGYDISMRDTTDKNVWFTFNTASKLELGADGFVRAYQPTGNKYIFDGTGNWVPF